VLHSNTQTLVDYWRELRDGEALPARRAFDPAAIAELLPQTFMLGRSSPALPFRLAGELLTELNGRGLRGESFLDLWTGESRAAARAAAAVAVRDRDPVVVYADAPAVGGVLGLELVLAPLTGPAGLLDRVLGLCQPVTSLAVLQGAPVGRLTHRFTLRLGPAEARERPRLRLAVDNGGAA
jgi:hypothetical protein